MTVRRKLFLSFLLLAFLPTAALIGLSYYLATEGSNLLAARGVSQTLAAADSLAMWVVDQDQAQLRSRIEEFVGQDTLPIGSQVLPALGADFLWVKSGDIDSTWRTLMADQSERVKAEIASAPTNDTCGRMVVGDRLLIWCRIPTGQATLCVGRLLPERFFDLANQVIEGRTKFQSLSRTLLPVGQDLLLKIAIALIVVSLILSLLAAQMLSYGMSAPLEKLVEATKRISSGDLKHRIPPGASDEIGVLISNFNDMTLKLETTTQELLVAEREITWKETARTIAHEIKNLLTPVNIALFKIRNMLSGDSTEDADLTLSVDALTAEVDAIADLARQFSLFAHPPRLAPTAIDLQEMIDEVLAVYRGQAEKHQINVTIAPDSSGLTADRDLLRRALSNLIRNSLEATPYGGNIKITVERRGKENVIEIKDDGPGTDQTIDLTLPYVTTKKSGTGLGLAIVKKVCEAHGWSLSYGNASPGFVVSIRIPIADEEKNLHS